MLPLLLASCLFKDPVFTTGFTKTDDSFTGVSITEEEMATADRVACFKVDDSDYILHYPAWAKGGIN